MKISFGARGRIQGLRFSLGLLAAAGVHLPHPAAAMVAGWRQYTVPVSASNPEAIAVALYYPTQAPAPTMAMGPFAVRVAVMAPLGVVFTAPSLASIGIPTAIYAAERDRWLVPRFHAEWIAQNVPGAEFHSVHNAWHFAFMDRPGTPVPTPDGDAAADPPGYRAALLAHLAVEIPTFFDKALVVEK
jgi:hypothetical protein